MYAWYVWMEDLDFWIAWIGTLIGTTGGGPFDESGFMGMRGIVPDLGGDALNLYRGLIGIVNWQD